ncbi:retrovirus-related pol polyprotein from transposon TNT 1-94 [Tanacetum coccineum]
MQYTNDTIQADCDIKAINIILQGLPTEIYALVSQHHLHIHNVDQIHAHLEQHERHANEVRLMHERNSDPLALYGLPYQSQQCLTHQSSTHLSITYPSNEYHQSIHHNVYSPSSSIPQLEYAPSVNQQSEFSQPKSGLIVPVFQKGDDPIDAIKHMMSFLTVVVTSRYPSKIKPAEDIRANQATCHIMMEESEWEYLGESVDCYMLQLQRGKDTDHASGQILHEEDLAFLADSGIPRRVMILIYSVPRERTTVIKKVERRINALNGKNNEDRSKQELEEIVTYPIINNFFDSNKQATYSIKHPKEQCDGLINQVNIKSAEISDLNASLQEKALAITALKDELRKLKGKSLVDNNVSNHPSDPELHQVNVEPITPKLLNKRTVHSAYIKHSQEEVAVLRDLIDHIKANYPLDLLLESACKYTKLIQEMLSKISKTCPSINSSGEQLVAVTPMNKVKSVRFTEPVTSSRNTKTAHTSNLVSNKPMLSSTGVKQSTSASGSQPSGNTKKDKIQQTPSSTLKNKVEAHPRKVKSSLKNKDHVVEPKGTAPVQHSKLNANSDLKCVKCNGCMLYDNHDLCVLDFINNVNARAKSRSVKKNSKRKVWKPTGKVFTNIGYIWRPTGRTFTIVGNACPLTRITTTTEVPLRKSSALDNKTPKPVVTLVYSRKPRKSKTSVLVNNYKVIKSVTANNSELSQSRGSIVSNVLSSSLDECRSSKLSSVAFRQHTCYIRNLEGADLLTRSQGDNLYTLSLGDMMASSPICLLSKASKTKSWLWHPCLSHLNFRAINNLVRHGLVRGLPKLKFEKDHLCSACALGKSTKKPHKPKFEDTNQEKLYLLHMDLCGPMRVTSVNGKKYILVIVDDYS